MSSPHFISLIFVQLETCQTLHCIDDMLQATGDKFNGPVVHTFLDSLMHLEKELPGSCEVLIGRMLHRLGRSEFHLCSLLCAPLLTLPLCSPLLTLPLCSACSSWYLLVCSSKESSLQSLQETATSVFAKKSEPPSEPPSNKKMANTPSLAAPTVSPLARFLLTRFV